MSDLVLNPSQHEAVHSDDALLCVACPGSGKTRTLVERVGRIMNDTSSSRVLMTTFSRDAAEEMRQRIQASCGKAALERIKIGTFHALALEQLKAAGPIGRIIGKVESEHMIRSALARAKLTAQVAFEEAGERIAMCRIDQEFADRDPAGAQLAHVYVKLMRSRNAIDFTDIMLDCVIGMETGKLKPIATDHLMGDEFQDIDRIQFRWMMAHLQEGVIPCVVGDDDQAIYGFRRALGYGGMMEFVSACAARIITLGVNYRSTARILSAADRLIAHNLDRVTKCMEAHRGDGADPAVIEYKTTEEQAGIAMSLIRGICAGNPIEHRPGKREYTLAVKPGQLAVLARTNHHLMAIECELRADGIPYVRAGQGLLGEKAVQAYLSLLSALAKGDEMGLEVALRWAGVAEDDLHALLQLGGGKISTLASMHLGKTPGGLAVDAFLGGVHDWRPMARGKEVAGAIQGAADWMGEVLNNSYKPKTAPLPGTTPAPGDEVADDISDSNAIAQRCIQAIRTDLQKLAGSLSQRLMLVQRDDKGEGAKVVLSTFHAAKGLEWEHVILTDVNAGVVPSNKSTTDAQIEEERRLFYVAMTRARDRLYLLTSVKRGASEFVEEAGLFAQ